MSKHIKEFVITKKGAEYLKRVAADVRLIVAAGIMALAVSVNAQQTADIEFTFTQPNSRTDGSALDASELDRSVLSVQGGGVLAEIPASAPSVTTITNFAVAGGECFELVTYDTQGLFSDPAIVCLKARPGKAQTINIRVNFTGN